jgi:hypothetical protein
MAGAEQRPELTGEQVSRAERRDGITHPVLSVIEQHLPTINHLTEGYSQITNNQEQQRYIREHYGFLADAFVEAGPYTMEPTDIVAIWSRATEVFSGYHRYALAQMISSAYAIQGLDNPEWRRYPRHYLETSELPEEVTEDRDGMLHAQSRLDEIDRSLKDIDFYVYGTHESAMSLAFNLSKKEAAGDQEAKRQLEELIAHQESRTTPVLGQIHENFGNGLYPLYFPLMNALKKLD